MHQKNRIIPEFLFYINVLLLQLSLNQHSWKFIMMKLLIFVSLKKLSFGIIIQYLMTVSSQVDFFVFFSKLPQWTIQPII